MIGGEGVVDGNGEVDVEAIEMGMRALGGDVMA